MWSILALGAAERLINQTIDLDAISRQQLNQLHGQLLRVCIDHPHMSVDVFFDLDRIRLETTATGQPEQESIFEPQGQFSSETKQQAIEATATLGVKNIVELVKLVSAQHVGNISLSGDYRLLQSIQQIMQQMHPDLASKLAPWIGSTAAHELGKLQQLPQLLKRNLQSKLFFVEDALKEDSQLLAPRWQMDQLQQGSRQLQQNLDRLDARIQALQQHISPDQT
ncbi:hypothetical protein [Acinetobacter sp. MD2(2019)]|uniref:hypothetical protein n=1 Tax=Acinetobacter sp. MD2(2019) TaxID=2605273 RepID=UPI002D1F33B2|nr:hypothetical protein [Acinetobacter sp. MD2(2019)]MEB3753234.1 hypothetical protein [Acinetobacter sp. MD2(2019)]